MKRASLIAAGLLMVLLVATAAAQVYIPSSLHTVFATAYLTCYEAPEGFVLAEGSTSRHDVLATLKSQDGTAFCFVRVPVADLRWHDLQAPTPLPVTVQKECGSPPYPGAVLYDPIQCGWR